MSEPSDMEGVEIISEENEEENSIPNDGGGTAGSLFNYLSPELLLHVFQWIGPDDMKSYIRLAISGDPAVTRFIYTECTYLWRHLDLAKFPGITDPQLQSLLERINARSITESITFDKKTSSPITGVGLEPLRHSRVLESIDLRQSDAIDYGPTGLDDELVSDILLSMLPHKLTIVKIRKQHDSRHLHYDEYCFSWSSFFANLRVIQARKSATKSCTHCSESLFREGRDSTECALRGYTAQCGVCKGYSCRPWNPDSSVCPRIRGMPTLFNRFCSCLETTTCDYCHKTSCSACEQNQLTCEFCDDSSCSMCQRVIQCKECRLTGCSTCPRRRY